MKTLMISLLVLIVLWLVYERRRPASRTSQIQVLHRQAARYAVAAAQDAEPVISVLHANYAMGYLLAIKDLVTADEFFSATGKYFLEFEKEIARVQDSATLRLVSQRTDLVPKADPNLLEAMYFQN